MNRKTRQRIEFGDFQTPFPLADEICALLHKLGYTPNSILEPTCGRGHFILAALKNFDSVSKIIGLDINPAYIESLALQLGKYQTVALYQSDFFDTNWREVLSVLPDPLLILGNPPWVTNAELSTFEGNNLPPKNNFQKYSGFDAITGASNFDISEWMLLRMFEWVRNRNAIVAMLCKTTVARKVLLHEWKNNPKSGRARMFLIDTLSHFGVSVEACLLVYDTCDVGAKICNVHRTLSPSSKSTRFGYEDGQLVANIDFYKKWRHLQTGQNDKDFVWRSGIKHDCAKVMELTRLGNHYRNGLGERVDIEETFVYPMMKSSDVAKSVPPHRFMLITQKFVGQETAFIRTIAPKTWNYLLEHRDCFERRKSAIYRNNPPFSIFGVGDYSFSNWKVAISGLYKKIHFVPIGPHDGKPVVLDDTCYFLACPGEEEARLIATLLNSQPAVEFFSSFVFWDAKRPVTAKILNKINIIALAKIFQPLRDGEYNILLSKPEQLRLLEQEGACLVSGAGNTPISEEIQ